MNNYEKLTYEVIERSRSKDPHLSFQEWDEVFTYVLTTDDDPETCLCGKHPIYEIFKLRNRVTDEEIMIGNVCIKRFRNGDKLEKVFSDYKKVKKDINKRLSQSTLDYMQAKQVPGFQNYNFYSKRANRKITTLSSSELSVIHKVNQLFINFIERTTSKQTATMTSNDVVYNGIIFKSRLAARWAVYFDVVGIKYEYAGKVIELPDRKVTPDFWLPQVEKYAYVKSNPFTDSEISSIDETVLNAECSVLMLVGAPNYGAYNARELDYPIDSDGDYVLQGPFTVDYILNGYHGYLWNESRFYSSVGCEFMPCETNKTEFLDMFDDGRTEEAVNKARSHRFD